MNQMDDLILPTPWVFPYPDREMYSKEQMLEYAKKAVEASKAEEREACAKACDEYAMQTWADYGEYSGGYGDEIRKRSNT